MKKFLSLLLTIVTVGSIAFSAISANAETKYVYNSPTGSFNYIILNDGTVEIEREIMTNGISFKKIIIPSYIDGRAVTSIDSYAFSSTYSNAENVEIPNTVKKIGEAAFYKSKITEIVIPSGVETVEKSAFNLCKNLKKVVLQDGVKTIGINAFYSCSLLTSVSLPKSLLTIGDDAFAYCEALTSIVFPESLLRIDAYAFCGTSLKNAVIPRKVEYIGSGAFYTKTLNSVKILNPNCVIESQVLTFGNVNTATTIYGYANSTAKEYADKHWYIDYYKFKYLDPKVKTVKLSSSVYTYSGTVKKPTITAIDDNGTKIRSGNYTLTYSNNKNVGKATVKVTFKGNYSGSKILYFTINPKGTSISKLTKCKKKFTVKWKKQATQTTGYQVQYSTDKKFKKGNKTVTVKGAKKTSKSISKLKGKKKYYVRVRTYKTVKGKNYYSSWSKVKSVTTKK